MIGATAIGREERSGMLATSYLATLRRHCVILAKAAIVATTTFVIGTAASCASYLVARPIQRGQGYVAPAYPEPDLLSGPPVRAIVGTGVLIAVIGVYALGVTTIVRRTSIAIPIVVGTIILPGLVFTSDRLQAFAQRWTPFAGFAIQHTVERPDYHAGPWHGLGITAAFAAIALVAGVVLARHRDL